MTSRLPGALRSKGHALVQFFTAQGLAMAANLLYGLLCVRLLPAGEYAKFVVVFGVQGSLLGIMDANLTNTLIPLIGERVEQRRLIADYVASLRQLALGAYLVVCAGFVFLYPYLVKHRQWSWQTIAAMVAILLLSTWCFRISTIYGAVMIMLRDRGHWYKGQLISAVGTLAMLLAAQALHAFGAFQAILFNVTGIVFVAWYYSRHARRLLAVQGEPSREKRKAIVRLALPNMPQAFFYAVQGQIPLYLITFLGRTTGVASVGALGRLGQIFAILMQGNPLLVEPYFARLPKERLKRSYVIAIGLAAVVCFGIFMVSVAAPGLLLWLLGPQYQGLTYEVRIVVGAGAVSCISGMLWCIHSARRFIYWWSVGLSIVLTFATQLGFVLRADMGTLRSVLWLNLATAAVSASVNLLSGIWGFLRGPREAELPTAEPQDEALIEAASVLAVHPADEGSAQTPTSNSMHP